MKHFLRLGSLVVMGCTGLVPLAIHAENGVQLVQWQDSLPLLLHSSSQGYLGIDVHDLDPDRATALKLKDPRGAEIVTVDHDAPAGKAGLRLHDVILQMNGQAIESTDQLRHMLHEITAGKTINLVISRDGQPIVVNVQLANRAKIEKDALKLYTVPQPIEASQEEVWALPSQGGFGSGFFGSLTANPLYVGAVLDPVGAQLADYFGVKDGVGLLVHTVDDNSPAAVAGLKAGDVVLRVGNDNMVSRNDWLRAIRTHRGKQIQLTVVRNKREQVLTMVAGEPKK
jgi:S1-C subfamily serine protease